MLQTENAPAMLPDCDTNFDGCVADDSQKDDNDLYLSDCKIALVGFEASEMRKLVSIICRGGVSRYMSLNENFTHIVVGTPSEIIVLWQCTMTDDFIPLYFSWSG
ncbi:DNA topoisomerase 2-binding protein 1 [Heracleum sosnowskyi]|uniref:DNA topoisomerase 2-binding protein 1 n=1 Tax=Heracleum sosnowskyi TaxID=360622 RepID=A0AAD8J5M6_9APIA|nr:DNA topoisomerase 2-binding protein 1 [Heracleum sosnowskyi]